MTKDDSVRISAEIAAMISGGDLVIDYTESEFKAAQKNFSQTSLEGYRCFGLLGDYKNDKYELEKFFVVKKLCDKLELWLRADDTYLRELFRYAKIFTEREFYADPYLLNISVPNTRIGNFMLLNVTYERGEVFQHEMPDFEADIIVPRLGFFTATVAFPSIYEGSIPWVSVCPSEISSMRQQIHSAHGKTLVLGLGLGYYPYVISKMETVETITIIERQPEIIELFKNNILPQFDYRDKIKILQYDAFDYLDSLHGGEFDFCFADIWEGQTDGADAYLKIKASEKRLSGTEFTYWIEEQIISYLKQEERKKD